MESIYGLYIIWMICSPSQQIWNLLGHKNYFTCETRLIERNLLATMTSFGWKTLACHYPKYACWLQWLLLGGKHWLAIILNMLVGYNDLVQVENIGLPLS
jgi:hypothetical protein